MFHKSHCDPLSATSHCTYSHHHAISGHLPSKVLTSRAESLSTCLSVDNCGQNSTETGSWGILPQARLVLWGPLTGLDELLIRPTWKRGEIRRCLLNLIFFLKKPSNLPITWHSTDDGLGLPLLSNIDSWACLTPACKLSLAPSSGASFARLSERMIYHDLERRLNSNDQTET